MKQSTLNPFLIIASIVGFMLLVGVMLFMIVYLLRPESIEARTYPGAIAQIGVNNISGSTTQRALTDKVITQIFGTSTCVARIITTTGGDSIYLSFYDGAPVLGQYNGHRQGASSTETYDSDQFGCGLVRVFAIASTTVTATETR